MTHDVEDNDDLIFTQENTTKIVELINNCIVHNKCMNIFVFGQHGTGKTTSVNVAISQCNAVVTKFDTVIHHIKSSKNTKFNVETFLSKKNIMKSKIILIDNLQSYTTQIEKNIITTIIKKNAELKKYLIIVICDMTHNKITSEIKKNSTTIKYNVPTLDRFISYLKTHTSFDNKTMNEIITKSDGDINKFKLLINENSKVKYEKKESDFELYKSTNSLLHNFKSINECLNVYNYDKVLIPLMMIGLRKEYKTVSESV